MSLDVFLTTPALKRINDGSGIFVREGGQTREISRKEWDEKFPGREPVVGFKTESEEVYSANITHNLNKMAEAAGIYKCLWRPDENGITKAGELILLLKNGIRRMKKRPNHFKKFDAPNGWGTYDDFLPWLERYLAACEENPEAEVSVSR